MKGRVCGDRCLHCSEQTSPRVWPKAAVPPQLLSSCSEPAGPPCAPAPAPNPPGEGQQRSHHRLGQPGQLPVQPSSPYLLVAGLGKLPEHLIQLGLVLLQVPILLAQLLLQHREQGISRAGSGVQASSHGRGNGGSCQHQGTCTGCALPAVRAECQSYFLTRSVRFLLPRVPLAKDSVLRPCRCPREHRFPRDQRTTRGANLICTSAGHSAATTKNHDNKRSARSCGGNAKNF